MTQLKLMKSLAISPTLQHPSAAGFSFLNSESTKVYEIINSLGIIRVVGTVTEEMTRQASKAVDDFSKSDEVKTIAFLVQSGGGGITGVKELSDRIKQVAKPKYAFISGLGASAAYWIASASDVIFTTATSEVGGVGVFLSFFDESKMLEQIGVKVNFFASGPLKGLGTPGVSLTQDQSDHLQMRVDELAMIFKADMIIHRAGIDDSALQGQTFLGRAAIASNLADALVIDEQDFFRQINPI